MPKFSVKRPFMVMVAVLVLTVLSIVGLTRMTTDLLPSMNLPYMVVITTYPGASPQKVEAEVTNPIEDAVGTLNGIKNITSSSAENASQVMLEFEEDTNMDSALVKVTSAINQLDFPDLVSKPYVLEISLDMVPVQYVSVDKDGLSGNKLSQYINDKIIPELKRQDGVSSITAMGLIEDAVEIRLNQDKIDDVNLRIAGHAESKLADAKAELDKAQKALNKAKKKIKKQEKKLKKQQKKSASQMAQYTKLMNQALANQAAYDSQYQSLMAYKAALEAEKEAYESLGEMGAAMFQERIAEIDSELSNLTTEIAVAKAASEAVDSQVAEASDQYEAVESGKITASAAFGSGTAQLAQAKSQIESSQKELDNGYESYEKSRKEALKNANANQLLSLDTLSGILTAENFSMPVGYIDGKDGQYLLKVDGETESREEIEDMILTHIDGVGDISVFDVADVTLVNNGGDSYAKVNGNDAVILSVYKTSSAGTAVVSDGINDTLNRLTEEEEGLHFTMLMDQGEYIDIIVKSVFQNLIYGALLAILVLLLFLRNFRPTLVVAMSIPISVLFALLLMYFAGISMNIISLSGLALGIGMLVDNSIVVMENIYRLRAQGIPSARAAVMGANQVAGAIAASTLTTICVFVPVLFTEGITRELMQDMCFTITFSLLASLAVALTVVPSMSEVLLRNVQPREHKLTLKVQSLYEKLLDFCLRFKIVPLALAVSLLAICLVRVSTTGIVMIPEMGSTEMTVSITMPPETSQEEDYEAADAVAQQMMEIKGVNTVGAMQAGSIMGAAGANKKSFTGMLLLDEEYARKNKTIARHVEAILDDGGFEDYQVQDTTMDTGTMLGSGLQIDIYGNDEEKLLDVSNEVMDIVAEIKGFENITNGQEDADREIVLTIDKDEAIRYGLTVAQIYQALQEKLTTEKTATTITVDGDILNVDLKDDRKPLTKENLMNFKIEGTTTDDDGNQVTKKYKLKKFAKSSVRESVSAIRHDNGSRYISINADTADGYNTTLLSRDLSKKLEAYDMPAGYTYSISGETENVEKMVRDMLKMMLVAIILIYLIMVAQFANLLSPFIVMFTIPLAFTGGFLALMATGQELSMLSLMGFLILSGVVVNNGIVFIDYANQLRKGGMEKRQALKETGKARMRPIMMTALTTILAMSILAVSKNQGAEMGQGMAIVSIGGLAYATLMTLFVVPVMYDLFYRREIRVIDLGDESTLNAKEGEEE